VEGGEVGGLEFGGDLQGGEFGGHDVGSVDLRVL